MKMTFFSPAPRPANEEARQQAVDETHVLEADGDPELQELVEQMAGLFDAQVAAVSIVDRDRQYFVAITGLDGKETSRAVSFCAHAILDPHEIFYVPDAERDNRFAGNPLVTGGPAIRFYVGAPLVTADGHALGALCAADGRPREKLTEEERARLTALAERVMEKISTRAA